MAEMAVEGLIARQSANDVATTLARLTAVLKAKGITVFAVIDHAAGARGVGMELRPTTLAIFGNPQAGTPVMQAAQTAGIDLPLKALIWQDEAGAVWFGYDDPAFIAARHGIPDHPAVAALRTALAALAEHATAVG